jgi:hypothetical protein
MTNINCLAGIACPACGHSESFFIEAIVTVRVTDDGSEDAGGEHFWDDSSPCTCGSVDCDHAGAFAEFRIENQAPKGGAA